ncbi:MAG: cysteine hydrolase [Chloroflexi bacterium]|nr:cysteine hydrolase [Chloroflexota bacterium]
MLTRSLCALIAALGLLPLAAFAQSAPSEPPLPLLPDLVPVAVDANTTAFLVLDINSSVCQPRPVCTVTVPAIARLLDKARAAGAFVGFSTTGTADVLPEIAPRPGEPVFSARADKFYNSDLDQTLQQHGIQTLVLVGSAANGAVLYTSFGASERGYTVVVATDGISSAADFDTFLAEYQLLDEPGFANLANDPLHANAVTLSRGDLITFSTATK